MLDWYYNLKTNVQTMNQKSQKIDLKQNQIKLVYL